MCVCVCAGCRKAREAVKHFGPPPGVPHSHSKYVLVLCVWCVSWCLVQTLCAEQGKEVREGSWQEKEQRVQSINGWIGVNIWMMVEFMMNVYSKFMLSASGDQGFGDIRNDLYILYMWVPWSYGGSGMSLQRSFLTSCGCRKQSSM